MRTIAIALIATISPPLFAQVDVPYGPSRVVKEVGRCQIVEYIRDDAGFNAYTLQAFETTRYGPLAKTYQYTMSARNVPRGDVPGGEAYRRFIEFVASEVARDKNCKK